MKIIKYPDKKEWEEILKRPALNHSELFEKVNGIINEVINSGDAALKRYTQIFDGLSLNELSVPVEEIRAAGSCVPGELKSAIEKAYSNIRAFHSQQVWNPPAIETEPGVRCWQKSVPIQRVGLYIPGGSAPLLSTVLMLGIPARLAGCREIILCTPPGKNGKVHEGILYIASLLEIDRIFKVGGAQAIAAMACGTETIPAVNKIFGPGNQYVTAAKVLVSIDRVAIDMPAGPSEVAIIADASGEPGFIAADLLSQAEHGPDSQVLLFTPDEEIIPRVISEINDQIENLPRKDIAREALRNSRIILLKSINEIVEMVNRYAPEHLIIASRDYLEISAGILNAGSVFLGNYTPESAGDYASGTNHTLPTGGWAHAFSGVNIDSFVKKITFQEISRTGLKNIGQTIIKLAEAEELYGHANAVAVRINNH